MKWSVGGGNKEEEWGGVGNNGEGWWMVSSSNVLMYKSINMYILTDRLVYLGN